MHSGCGGALVAVVVLGLAAPIPAAGQALQPTPERGGLAAWDAWCDAAAAVPPEREVDASWVFGGPAGLRRHLGVRVPRSPVSIAGLCPAEGPGGGGVLGHPHGPARGGRLGADAAQLAALGYDRVYEMVSAPSLAATPEGGYPGQAYDRWFSALAVHGLRGGLIVPRPSELPGQVSEGRRAGGARSLPARLRQAFRAYQLVAQRFAYCRSFAGIHVGADTVDHSGSDLPRGDVGGLDDGGALARAVAEAVPRLSVTIPISANLFRGIAPGPGAPAGIASGGLPLFVGTEPYETPRGGLLHVVGLIDRLRSHFPDKPAWALLDDAGLHDCKGHRERRVAMALTRGLQGVATSFPARATAGNPEQRAAGVRICAERKELFAWIHRYGGAYAHMRPEVRLGIVFCQELASGRPVPGREGEGARTDPGRLRTGSHDSKVMEALIACHAAGVAARIVTVDELARGLPAEIEALLLVGLGRIDDTWAWHDLHEGLAERLRAFGETGGRILADDTSDCPVACTRPGLSFAPDAGPQRLEGHAGIMTRNAETIRRLRAALAGLAPHIVTSDDPALWTVVSKAGSTRYVTVLNYDWEEENGAVVDPRTAVPPRAGRVRWHTDRPIYDLRSGGLVTSADAGRVDLREHAFRLYVLPEREVSAPKLRLRPGGDGFYEALVTVPRTGSEPRVPVAVTVVPADEAETTVHGVTGVPIALPVHWQEDSGTVIMRAEELLTGQRVEKRLEAMGELMGSPAAPIEEGPAIRAFVGRRTVPVVIALTPAQREDPSMAPVVKRVTEILQSAARTVTHGVVAPRTAACPDGIVLGRQPLLLIQKHPQWRTVDADVVLFGTPRTNPLIRDQAVGRLLPDMARYQGTSMTIRTCSPFVGGRQVLNLIANDAAGLAQLAEQLCPYAPTSM